jgi:hypothetical protein
VYDLSNPEEVREAEIKERNVRRQELNDIRTLLNNASGRRFMWRMLEQCKVFNSIYSESDKQMAYYAGKQDLGHFLMSEISEADNNLLIKLMKDNRKEV